MDNHQQIHSQPEKSDANHPFDQEKSGASMSPPGLQLKASGSANEDNGAPSIQRHAAPGVDGPIQRKVYVDQRGQTVEKEQNTGNPLVDQWIGDQIHRHYTSTQEMNQHAAGQTENLGTLGPNNAWIRLDPNAFLVVGERHSETTMFDLVSAVNTTRYLHEPYNEIPGNRGADFPNTSQENQTETDALQVKANQPQNDNTNHHMEHLFPKVSYALMKIHDYQSNNSWAQHTGNGRQNYAMGERVAFYFGFGLNIARDVHGQVNAQGANPTASERALAQSYGANQQMWQMVLADIDAEDHIGTVANKMVNQHGGQTAQLLAIGRLMMDYFHDDYVAHMNPQGADRTTVDDTQAAMNAQNPDYGAMRQNINSWREQYMWQRVQDGVLGNYMLAGMGDAHRRNMAAQMDQMGINHLFMDTLMQQGVDDAQQREGKAITETQYLQQNPPANNNGGGGCCYITTACVVTKGLPDDCHELQTLRALRDEYIMHIPGGKDLVKLYYNHSPDIVRAINQQEDAVSIYRDLYGVVQFCVDATMMGDYALAFQVYCEMVKRLKNEYVPEMQVGQA